MKGLFTMMKKVKKFSLGFLSALMMFSLFTPSLSAFAYTGDLDIQEILEEGGELTEDEFDEFIGAMEAYISFEDGEIIINEDIEDLSYLFGEEVIELMVEGIENLNELADENEIVITDNGTVYEVSDDEFVVQGGVNKTTWHWWGTRVYLSTRKVAPFANKFSNLGSAAGVVAAVSGGFGFKPVSVPAGLLGIYWTKLARDMNNRNAGHSRGIKVSMTWVMAYSTARQ